ncbi:ArsR family transcriptional regulator [Halorarum halophilum]|uniref:ArsR family transcriptional regulator n=1 Tax=Halorarum halophilum TaxID=2743090 RepID=A0A7D5GX04_9EURY|nr:ArsR family transcriptional regulator [Halobaculum halophilum]QLG27369.1 ArsR family transcriptional regulator [Halobaculum halophilum]
MRLTSPTDFEILEALADGNRNNAANLSYELDKNRSYINTRFPVLAEYDLVERVGPAPNSGLYEITDRGCAAVALREQYDDGNFDVLIDDYLDGVRDG